MVIMICCKKCLRLLLFLYLIALQISVRFNRQDLLIFPFLPGSFIFWLEWLLHLLLSVFPLDDCLISSLECRRGLLIRLSKIPSTQPFPIESKRRMWLAHIIPYRQIIILDLKSVRIDPVVFDFVNRRHILLIMLFCFLLFAKLFDLEKLKPALVAEYICTELDHFTTNVVVRRDVPCCELEVNWLNVS